MKKPSPVSRSVYQKLAEENKKLKADIKTLVIHNDNNMDAFFDTFNKWVEHFREIDNRNAIIRAGITRYLEDHPEYKIRLPDKK